MEQFYCRKCRHNLELAGCIVKDHTDCTDVDVAFNQASIWYVSEENCPAWLITAVEQASWTKGKLICEKCKGRLGSFNFINTKMCACHRHVLPAIHFLKDRLDNITARSQHNTSTVSTRNMESMSIMSPLSAPANQQITNPRKSDLGNNNAVCTTNNSIHSIDNDVPIAGNSVSPTDNTWTYMASDNLNATGAIEPTTEQVCETSIPSARSRSPTSSTGSCDSPDGDNIGTDTVNGDTPCATCDNIKLHKLDSDNTDIVNTKPYKGCDTCDNIHLTQPGSLQRHKDVAGGGTQAESIEKQPLISQNTAENVNRVGPDSMAESTTINSENIAQRTIPVETNRTGPSVTNIENTAGRTIPVEMNSTPRSVTTNFASSDLSDNNLYDALREDDSDQESDAAQDTPIGNITEDMELPAELTCPVCLELFYRPHICSPCRHVFCESCLRDVCKQVPVNTPCPLCRKPINSCSLNTDLQENIQISYWDQYNSRKEDLFKMKKTKNFYPLPGSSAHRKRTARYLQLLETHNSSPGLLHSLEDTVMHCLHDILVRFAWLIMVFLMHNVLFRICDYLTLDIYCRYTYHFNDFLKTMALKLVNFGLLHTIRRSLGLTFDRRDILGYIVVYAALSLIFLADTDTWTQFLYSMVILGSLFTN